MPRLLLRLAGKDCPEQLLPVEIRIGAKSYGAIALLFDRLGQFQPIVALARLNVSRNGAEAGGALAADLTLEVPILKQRAGHPGETRESKTAGPPTTAVTVRQPFKALKVDEPAQLQRARPEGVAGLLIDDLELRGIFRTSKGYVAQVSDRKAKRSYLLKGGDRLFDGEIVRITKDEAVFRQQTPGAAENLREVVKSLKTP